MEDQESYEENLRKKVSIPEPFHMPENNLKGVKSVVIGAVAIGLALTGLNLLASQNALNIKYDGEVRNNSKVTGLTTYVVYREIKNGKTLEGNVYEHIDMITKGSSFFSKKQRYLDIDGDKKVDFVRYHNKGSIRVMDRKINYKDYKEEFDKFDKFFAKYFEELSK